MSGPRARRPSFPVLLQDRATVREQIVQANLLMAGKFNNVDDFTLLEGQTSVVVVDARVSIYSAILVTPLDAIAASLVTWAEPGEGQFVFNSTAAPLNAMWASLRKDVAENYDSSSGPAKIGSYDGPFSSSSEDLFFSANPTPGELTLLFGGDFSVDLNVVFNPANNKDYRFWIARNGSFLPADAAAFTYSSGAGGEQVVVTVNLLISAVPGDVIAAYIERIGGGVDDIMGAALSLKRIGGTDAVPLLADAPFRYAVIG